MIDFLLYAIVFIGGMGGGAILYAGFIDASEYKIDREKQFYREQFAHFKELAIFKAKCQGKN